MHYSSSNDILPLSRGPNTYSEGELLNQLLLNVSILKVPKFNFEFIFYV